MEQHRHRAGSPVSDMHEAGGTAHVVQDVLMLLLAQASDTGSFHVTPPADRYMTKMWPVIRSSDPTRIHSTDAQQGAVGDGGQVVCGHGGDGLRGEVPVVQHARGQLRQVPPVALMAVQPPIVLAPSGAL